MFLHFGGVARPADNKLCWWRFELSECLLVVNTTTVTHLLLILILGTTPLGHERRQCDKHLDQVLYL